MPVIFRDRGARYFFYSNEGSPREPVHVHVERGDGEAKFWVGEHVVLAESFGFNRRELAELTIVIETRRIEIEKAWHEYFG